jgi:hypothetical protein
MRKDSKLFRYFRSLNLDFEPPCKAAMLWLQKQHGTSTLDIWNSCPNADWLIWWLDATNGWSNHDRQLFICDCVLRMLRREQKAGKDVEIYWHALAVYTALAHGQAEIGDVYDTKQMLTAHAIQSDESDERDWVNFSIICFCTSDYAVACWDVQWGALHAAIGNDPFAPFILHNATRYSQNLYRYRWMQILEQEHGQQCKWIRDHMQVPTMGVAK